MNFPIIKNKRWRKLEHIYAGSFVIRLQNKFESANCRNRLLSYLSMSPYRNEIGYSCYSLTQRDRIINFLRAFEKELNIKPFKCFVLPKNDCFIIIDFDDEWVKSPITTSFLLFLIKMSYEYDNKDINKYIKNFIEKHFSIYHRNVINKVLRLKSLSILNTNYVWQDIDSIYESRIGFVDTVVFSIKNRINTFFKFCLGAI